MAKYIPGTRVSIENQQLLISTGIPALDDLLGGGLPVGTIALVEEDYQGIYTKTVLRYFIAEGIINEHCSLIASLDSNPEEDILFEVPAVSSFNEDSKTRKGTDNKMVIAFRYEHLPAGDAKISNQFGHYFDLSRKMAKENITKVQNFTWNGEQQPENIQNPMFTNSLYWDLLQTIISTIADNKFLLTDNVEKRSILRIVLHCLGSPLWTIDDKSSEEHVRDIRCFFVHLRYILRKSFAVCVVSVPTHFTQELKLAFDAHLTHNSDIVYQLDAFAGTSLANNPMLAEYHGYFRINKVAAINSFKSNHGGATEYAFRLKRKKFVIKKLHLPPGIQENKSDSESAKRAPSFGCGSSDKHLLEF